MNFIEWSFLGNPVYLWFLALFVTLLTLFTLYLLRRQLVDKHLVKLAKRTRTTVDDLLADLLRKTKFFFLFLLSVYAGSLLVELPSVLSTGIARITLIAAVLQAAIWGNRLIGYLVKQYTQLEGEQEATAASTSALTFIGRLILWTLLILLALDNLGFEITALVTGLGIGGVAIALAAQNILGDLFGSLSILLDKPFVVGDFIIVGEYLGTVEYIGLKTTRIRSLSGEQLVFSNADLLNSRIRNYKRMYERRVVFSFGVVYQTAAEQLAEIPRMVRQIVEDQEPVRFDRAHFKEYGGSSLNFEVVYWVQNPDYNLYMDIQQNINLALFRRFQGEGIEFAYPTQTVYVTHETTPTPQFVKRKGHV